MDSREEREIFKTAKDLINQLSVVIRTAQVHEPNNVAVTSVIERLVSTVNLLISTERVLSLELRGEFFYLNDYRIRYSLEFLLNFDYLVREFKKRELGSIIFKD
jgi:hypothetical protein